MFLLPGCPPASGPLFLDWPDARRADRYRVWRKLPTDRDFLPVETTAASEPEQRELRRWTSRREARKGTWFGRTKNHPSLENQPLGVVVTYRFTAANDAGESQPSPEITLTLS